MKSETPIQNSEFRRDGYIRLYNTVHSEFFIRISSFLLQLTLFLSSGAIFAQSPQLKIGLLADVQYCACETSGGREYSKSTVKLDEAVRLINGEKVNLTVELGDLIDRDIASYDPIRKRLNTLISRWIFIPGNHDFNVGDSLKKSIWKMIPSKKGYWSEVIGDVRLVYVNGFQNSVIAYAKGSWDYKENKDRLEKLEKEKAKNASDWNGGLGKKQIEWIRTQVELANQSNQKFIVFGHQPIIPGEAHSLWDSDELIRVLSGYQHQVLYICGHKHSGGDHTLGNIRVLNLKGMVEQKETSFGVLSLYPGRWELKGFGGQESYSGILK